MPEWTKSPQQAHRVAFVLFDRFSNLCLANCLEPLRAANTLMAREVFRWDVYSPDGQPVASSSELPVLPRGALDDMKGADLLVVLASYGHLQHDTPANRRALSRAARRARRVAGHDAAPWLMASAGLLDGRMATIHGDLLAPFAERFLNVTVLPRRVVADGSRLTSAGAMAAFDLTLDLVREVCGVAVTLEIEALFVRDTPTEHDMPRARDPLIRRALSVMRATLDAPIALDALALRAGCRPKTLERRMVASLGATPGRVYRHLRLGAAFQMVTTTDLPVAEVAVRCGYESPAALTRAFRARYGAAPRDMRRTP